MMIAKHGRGRRIEPKNPAKESPSHLAWIRAQPCCVRGCEGRQIQAHHVRTAATSGTGLKPADGDAVPMCQAHHGALHQNGAIWFEEFHGLVLREIAMQCAKRSPVLKAREVCLSDVTP